jgi:hypothetical protein
MQFRTRVSSLAVYAPATAKAACATLITLFANLIPTYGRPTITFISQLVHLRNADRLIVWSLEAFAKKFSGKHMRVGL